MDIDPRSLARRDAYRLMISLVVPRPIAWVSTLDREGRANLAPFSFFGSISSHPPTVMLSIGRRSGGQGPKDTAANLIQTGEGVIHICHRPFAQAMVETSAGLAPEEDEFEHAGLSKLPATVVAPPRIEGAAIAMEAKVERHLEIGDGPNDVFCLEIVHVHVDDDYVVDGHPDPAKLQAVGRLGGSSYCDTAHPFGITRAPTP